MIHLDKGQVKDKQSIGIKTTDSNNLYLFAYINPSDPICDFQDCS